MSKELQEHVPGVIVNASIRRVDAVLLILRRYSNFTCRYSMISRRGMIIAAEIAPVAVVVRVDLLFLNLN